MSEKSIITAFFLLVIGVAVALFGNLAHADENDIDSQLKSAISDCQQETKDLKQSLSALSEDPIQSHKSMGIDFNEPEIIEPEFQASN